MSGSPCRTALGSGTGPVPFLDHLEGHVHLRTRTYPAVAAPVTTTQTYCVVARKHWIRVA